MARRHSTPRGRSRDHARAFPARVMLASRFVWDEEADPIVAALIERGDVPRVHALLRTWTRNGQPLPDGLPADLRRFMERARRLPAWTDARKLQTAVSFNEKRGLYLGLLYGLGSGMMSTVIPREARSVYLGVRHEYIPANWQDAGAQSRQVLDPLLAPTPEGVKLADILLSLAAEIDGGASRPFLHAMTRYLLGDEITGWLNIPREPFWDPFVRTGWPAFVRFRETVLPLPLAPKGYWTFDEFLRQGALFFPSEGRPISIELPDANRY